MKSSIVEARVFIDRAILTRRVNVPAGERKAVFEPLPLSIEVKALHARAMASDGRDLSVIGVRAQPVERTLGAEERERFARWFEAGRPRGGPGRGAAAR